MRSSANFELKLIFFFYWCIVNKTSSELFQVKRLAASKYNHTFGNESVSTFVTAFYDAVLLYGLALNETLAKGYNQSDGEAIVRAMWNKTFSGITGDVNIDANGDRIADYSLLDMDPKSNEFKVPRVGLCSICVA